MLGLLYRSFVYSMTPLFVSVNSLRWRKSNESPHTQKSVPPELEFLLKCACAPSSMTSLSTKKVCHNHESATTTDLDCSSNDCDQRTNRIVVVVLLGSKLERIPKRISYWYRLCEKKGVLRLFSPNTWHQQVIFFFKIFFRKKIGFSVLLMTLVYGPYDTKYDFFSNVTNQTTISEIFS